MKRKANQHEKKRAERKSDIIVSIYYGYTKDIK